MVGGTKGKDSTITQQHPSHSSCGHLRCCSTQGDCRGRPWLRWSCVEALAPRSTGLPTLGKYLVLLILFLLAEFSVQLSFVFILVIFAAALVIITLLAVQRHHWLHLRGPHKGREFLRALRLIASTRSCLTRCSSTCSSVLVAAAMAAGSPGPMVSQRTGRVQEHTLLRLIPTQGPREARERGDVAASEGHVSG